MVDGCFPVQSQHCHGKVDGDEGALPRVAVGVDEFAQIEAHGEGSHVVTGRFAVSCLSRGRTR